MSDSDKLDFIMKALTEIFEKDVRNISPSDRLLDLGLDSLDIVELQMHYEDVMHAETETDDVLLTVGDLMSVMK
jgi:acyl carrier protein